MPQTLNEPWKNELGENYSKIHEEYLHTFGNLTLTGYNSKYSNLSFKEKCIIEKGFNESRLYLNKFVSQQTCWTKDTMEERAHILFERALKIWKLPDSSFTKTNEDDWIGLDEDNIDYTGKSICQYKFLTELTPISDWTSMYKDVCKSLFLLDRSSFISFVNADSPENKTIKKRFNTTNTGMRNPFMVDSDVYIELNLNTQTKIEMLRVLFAHFNIDFQDLSFKLKATSENE